MKKYFLNSFTVGLLLTLVSLTIYRSEFTLFQVAELKAYDFKVRFRGPRPISGNVVIIAADEKSLAEQGRWPWPREKMAKLVDKLSEAGVVAIGFDVLFPEPDKTFSLETFESELEKIDFSNLQKKDLMQLVNQAKNSDSKFSEALLNSERVILGYFASESEDYQMGKRISELPPKLAQLIEFFEYGIIQYTNTEIEEGIQNSDQSNNIRTASEDPAHLLHDIKSIGMSIYELSSAANSAGFVSFIPEYDGVVRKIPLVQKIGQHFFPPLSLALVKQATGLNLGIDFGKYGVSAIRVGDTIVPSDEDGDYIINWYGNGYTFEHISATDVIEGRVGANELQNKIAIVGGTAAAIHDIHYSPFGGLYPGVEAHANIIENILGQDFMSRPVEFHIIDIAMILGTGLILSLVSLYFKVLVMAIVVILGVGGYIYVDYYYLFLEKGLWVNVFFPVFSQLFVYSGITLYRFTFEEREKRFIKGAFSQYLAPAVVNQLVGDPNLLKLGGESKVLTAFFSDVAGFSTISEKLTPEELVLLLNEYLSEMTDIIMKYEGTVDKFEGDAIIAFFGAPIHQEDHAKRACLATLDMQKRCSEMRKVWREQGKHELFMRIGLNTGPMVVGNMGSKTRMDYTMMGDSVNLAARLEGVNKQYGTYDMFSEFTYEHVKDEVEVRELDLIRVVGKSEPVRIYQLLCRKGELNEEMSKVIDLYAKGLEHYRKQEWDDALDSFGAVLEIDEKDGPSLTFFERCLLFQKEPPPADWDGVFSMKTK